MLTKRLVLLCSLPTLITGCADFHGTQPPAPVYSGRPDIYSQPAPSSRQQKPPKPRKQARQTFKTQPIQEPHTVPEVIELQPSSEAAGDPYSSAEFPLPVETPQSAESAEGGAPYSPGIKFAEPEESLQQLEPLQSLGPVKPAVGALVSAADQSNSSGNLDAAVATIERAIRIEPRNPALYYKLAELRLKQSKPRLAEDLAKKSALLASNNPGLKRQSWLLIGNARVMQKNYAGAKAARAKAAEF
jgi:hypothetical protein